MDIVEFVEKNIFYSDDDLYAVAFLPIFRSLNRVRLLEVMHYGGYEMIGAQFGELYFKKKKW